MLEQHLDVSRDPSLAIRSVLGHYFPILAAIDPDWASVHRSEFFPPGAGEMDLWHAAWNAYVRFNRVYSPIFALLGEEYMRAVERCGGYPVEGRELGEAKEGLAKHIMILYGRGTIGNEPGGLLRCFFLKAPQGLHGYAIRFVGRSLGEGHGLLCDVLDRFKRLWEWVVDEARSTRSGSAERERLAGFGSWFTSRVFETSWGVTRLEEVLRLAKRVDDARFVLETLAEVAAGFPSESIACLRGIIEADAEGWTISGAQDETRAILEMGLSSLDDDVRNEATKVVHDLGTRGFFSFRGLLSAKAPRVD